MLRFFWLIRHKRFHCKHAFTEKAQHLRRWISLRMFTRGRLVPRQPRAIKRTTRTELRGEIIMGAAWLIIKGEIGLGKQSLSPSPLLSSFRRLHEQRPMVPRRGRGVVSHENRGCYLKVNWWYWYYWLWSIKWFDAIHRVICRFLLGEIMRIIAWNGTNCGIKYWILNYSSIHIILQIM